jgi:hypothetical protein
MFLDKNNTFGLQGGRRFENPQLIGLNVLIKDKLIN